MNPGDLQNIFGALSVGLLTILSGANLHWIAGAERGDLYRWIKMRPWIPRNSQSMFFCILILYAIGVLAQDITDHFTDSEYFPLFKSSMWPPQVQQSILGKEESLRFSALFKKENGKWVYNSLGREVFSNKQFLEQALLQQAHAKINYNLEMQNFANDPIEYLKNNDKESQKIATRFVCKLYYMAKNWAYTNTNYFIELESVQRRIDFTRSAFHIGTWTILGQAFLAFLIMMELWIKRRLTPRLLFLSTPAKDFITSTENINRLFKSLVIIVVIITISKIGYRNAEENFNERAFGYYVSHLQRESSPSKNQCYSPSLFANLWMQTSGEYRAIVLQTYEAAYTAVKNKINSPHINSTKPYAVVMDLDETVLDNARYQNYLVLNHIIHTDDLWSKWVKHDSKVGLIPGASAFINRVRQLGVEVIFISNRPERLREYTEKSLRNLGIITPGSSSRLREIEILLEQDNLGKDLRREIVSRRYQIIAEIGDSLTDMSDDFSLGKEGKISGRLLLVDRFSDKWGTQWFVLPNPVYGEWRGYVDINSPEKYLKGGF